ncbi:hypothetical protein RFI_28991 [Reticulomyxa filosa]|uniref:G domain-containing protein n=1 Tax=Reticulomyxa filosa TaxID=46433 RepID=X6M363_RETFI|nr:hypothetical protein RFI_28991 [Reticulomyxa filosa]|eukprot:ETO08398.1 hypothetical protein RFI_28991 [Reticulomyxa filosa]
MFDKNSALYKNEKYYLNRLGCFLLYVKNTFPDGTCFKKIHGVSIPFFFSYVKTYKTKRKNWGNEKNVYEHKHTKAKYIVIESYGNEKATFKATDLRDDGRMPEAMKERNWEELLNTIKEVLHLTTTSRFLLINKNNIDDDIDNDDEFFDFWNLLIKDKNAEFYTLQMRCLGITKDDKRITWCPKNSNNPNFRGEMEKEDWKQHFEDLKQAVGDVSDDVHFEDESQEKRIQSGEDLQRIWAARYAEKDSDTWWLQMKVHSNSGYRTEGEQDDGRMHAQPTETQEGSRSNQYREEYLQSAYIGDGNDEKKEEGEERSGSIDKKSESNYFDIRLMLELVKKTEEAATAIKAVPLNLKERSIFNVKGDVVLCDTPGFDDTNGAEVDVANGIGIVRALQDCACVKPVVLISYTAQGNRMSCIKDLARTLVAIIPSIADHLSAFSYVFTKWPQDQVKSIHALIKDILRDMQQKDEADEGYQAILGDIAKKTKRGTIAPDLINDSPNELLEDLSI